MFSLGFFLGAVLTTGILSAIFNWLLRHHTAPITRIMMANGMSLFVATVAGGFGAADGGSPNFASAFASNVLPQLFWLIVGIVRYNRSVENKLPEIPHQVERVEPSLAATIPSDPEPPKVSALERPEHAQQRLATAARPYRFNNFIATNWRGEFPLWVSYWLFGFLGNITIGIIPILVATLFSVNTGYEPRTIFATLVATWLGVFVVATWQFVGVWRSATRHIEQRTRSGKLALWAGLAKLAVILGFLRLVVELGNAGVPQITEASRMAFMDDPSIPAYSIRIMRNGTEAEITGGFKYGLTDDFLRILRASPQIRVVHLNSIGGRIGEAEKLNMMIRDRGLLTYVSARCLSACTVAFAGGRERWLLEGAVLGFHAAAFPGMSDADLAIAARVQKDLFAAAGFDPSFVSRALATPNRDVWTPSPDELLRAKVITAVSDGSYFAASGYGAGVTKEDMAAKLISVLPMLGAIKERLPKDYTSLINGYYDGYVNGLTQTALMATTRAKLLPIITTLGPLSDDAVLVDLGKVLIEEYAALGAKNPTLCYLYASGEGGARNFSSDIPAPLIQREVTIGERVVATAEKRPDVTEQMTSPLRQKVMGQLGRRFGAEKIKLLLSPQPEPSLYEDYCTVSIALLQEIVNLKQNEAGLLMRHLLSGK